MRFKDGQIGLDIAEHIVMLYYSDVDKAREFYGSILKLKKALENDWVTLFQVTPKSFIGTVKEDSAGGYHKVQPENSVMVSIATNDVEGWYDRLMSFDDIRFIKHLYDAKSMPIKAFLIADTGGYTIEFFQWREKPAL
jgi:hypothetical protein